MQRVPPRSRVDELQILASKQAVELKYLRNFRQSRILVEEEEREERFEHGDPAADTDGPVLRVAMRARALSTALYGNKVTLQEQLQGVLGGLDAMREAATESERLAGMAGVPDWRLSVFEGPAEEHAHEVLTAGAFDAMQERLGHLVQWQAAVEKELRKTKSLVALLQSTSGAALGKKNADIQTQSPFHEARTLLSALPQFAWAVHRKLQTSAEGLAEDRSKECATGRLVRFVDLDAEPAAAAAAAAPGVRGTVLCAMKSGEFWVLYEDGDSEELDAGEIERRATPHECPVRKRRRPY